MSKRSMVLAMASVLGSAGPVFAWGTPEHIQFGKHIADPFEARGEKKLPVLRPKNGQGPASFADWVSAPDYGRGLSQFLDGRALVGTKACAEHWNAGDGDFDDQARRDTLDGTNPDCLDTWTINNNHFGDQAAHQYAYYHKLAVQAASRYYRTRLPECEQAAYTLEGWAQHHLTDATAAGHAWNPPGDYEHGLTTASTAVTVRMRLHNQFNDHGARMSGGLYDKGTFWGDHSEKHTADGKSIPESPGNVQRELTLRLSRMGLGQVVAAASCGAPAKNDDIFSSLDDKNDPRRVYVSNQSMCAAMYNVELQPLGLLDGVGIESINLQEIMNQCKADRGNLMSGGDGEELAGMYFLDKYQPGEAASVNLAVDPESRVTLEQLGCRDNALSPAYGEKDACGNELCGYPANGGRCGEGSVKFNGCCYLERPVDGEGALRISKFATLSGGDSVTLGAPTSGSGDPAAYVWQTNIPRVSAAGSLGALQETAVLSSNGERIPDDRCAKEATFNVYESHISMPNTAELKGKVLKILVDEMDEGLKVQVNGRLITYATRADLPFTVDAISNKIDPTRDGDYVLRLTHLNDCGAERPLKVRFILSDEKRDEITGGDMTPTESSGCSFVSSSPRSLISFALFFAALATLLVRRRLAPARTRR